MMRWRGWPNGERERERRRRGGRLAANPLKPTVNGRCGHWRAAGEPLESHWIATG